jgi:starch synthase
MAPAKIIKIFFLAAEAVPFVKVGGLGDVAGALPQYINRIKELNREPMIFDIRVALPYHSQIDQKYKNTDPIAVFPVYSLKEIFEIRVYYVKNNGVPIYLFDGGPINKCKSVYSLNTLDDGEKFTLFSKAALQFPGYIKWKPDILHVNDWHTAIAAYINQQPDFRKKIPYSMMTLHNLPFMGAGTEPALSQFDIPPSMDEDLPVWARTLPLPLGLASVDKIIAVSPNYAREIQKKEVGCGLDSFFRSRKKSVDGILNGIDTGIWDPSTDSDILLNFDKDNLLLRLENKRKIQVDLGFPLLNKVPLLVMVSRMDIQKGVDLVLEGLKLIADLPWQAVLLGSGDPILEAGSKKLEKTYPKKVKSILRFDSKLSHQLFAGCDILLMPSRYEPCGLTQMIAMRYGCIPVARKTGGLVDTIKTVPSHNKTGYLFKKPTAAELIRALMVSFVDYYRPSRWVSIQKNAMSVDFSWNKSALEYACLYKELVFSQKEK